jgi:hypothetical protein
LKVREGQLGDFAKLCGEYLKLACNKNAPCHGQFQWRHCRRLSAESARRQGSQECQSESGRARFKGKPSAYRQAGPLRFQRSSASACSRRPGLGIETANQGGSHERKAIPMSIIQTERPRGRAFTRKSQLSWLRRSKPIPAGLPCPGANHPAPSSCPSMLSRKGVRQPSSRRSSRTRPRRRYRA